jgi:hypothetical protein
MIGFLFFGCGADVLSIPDAVGCETVRCLPDLDEGLIPKGFDDGPDEIYAIDLGSGGGDALCFEIPTESLCDVDNARFDWAGFGGKGCLLTRGSAFDCVRGGFRKTGDGGSWEGIGSTFMVCGCAVV